MMRTKKTNKQNNHEVRAMSIQNFRLSSLVIFFLTFFFFAIYNRLVANKGNQNMKSKTETQIGKIRGKKDEKRNRRCQITVRPHLRSGCHFCLNIRPHCVCARISPDKTHTRADIDNGWEKKIIVIETTQIWISSSPSFLSSYLLTTLLCRSI